MQISVYKHVPLHYNGPVHKHTAEGNKMTTYDDAMREHVMNVGRDNPQVAWILTPYDVWMRNPAYHGPAVPHPEDDDGSCGGGGGGYDDGSDDIDF